jgi:hypothetical protein
MAAVPIHPLDPDQMNETTFTTQKEADIEAPKCPDDLPRFAMQRFAFRHQFAYDLATFSLRAGNEASSRSHLEHPTWGRH